MSGRVLVTGATGFIGGMLADRLAAEGYQVRCLVRDATTVRARALERAGFELHVGDEHGPTPCVAPAGKSMAPTS